MARASIYTLLSLDAYAKIMGIPPIGFNSGVAHYAFPLGGGCSDVWWQYDWQANDKVSHESLARAIYDAEEDISRALGWSPAPQWAWSDEKPWPSYYMRDVSGANWGTINGRAMPLKTSWRKVIAPGRRVATLVGTATATMPAAAPGDTLVYSDADGDSFNETATIVLPTTVTDRRELRFYFAGHSGEDEWEIRPARTLTIAGGNVTATFWSWQMPLIPLWEAFPGDDGMTAIDMEVRSNLSASVECWRVRNDESQIASQFVWMPDQSCDPCVLTLTLQDGTFQILDADNALVNPFPASYSTSWTWDNWSLYLPPQKVRLWYQHGNQQQSYLDGRSFEPLSDFWANAIAWLATARLERPFCACGNATALANELRVDLAQMGGENAQVSYATTEEILGCPFGTRKGAWMAWQRVARFGGLGIGGVAI